MKSWTEIEVEALNKSIALPELSLMNSKTKKIETIQNKDLYRIYVCGITPYDATHLGHAATYLTFDLIVRYLRAQGSEVLYVQNITDIDDPLLERATRDGLDWVELARSQIDLFMSDMVKLRVIPPDHYIGAVDSIPLVVSAISTLEQRGSVYKLEDDYYFANSHESDFGALAQLSQSEMEVIFAERGGNPGLAGKLNPLDCLLWMSQRPGEPGWDSPLGIGRPGWHIECTAIALEYLRPDPTAEYLIDIQGGGSDLLFPHHEMCRSQAMVLTGKELAMSYVHAGMIGLDGEKMSKSKGNLVLVSKLVDSGVDPMAIRYALMMHHYREDQMWSQQLLEKAISALTHLRQALLMQSVHTTDGVVAQIISALSDDLNTPRALFALESWVEKTLAGATGGDSNELKTLLNSLLGLEL